MAAGRNTYLLKNTAIFALGNFATKFISFFLVPLYTNILTATEYGVADLVNTVSTVAVPIISLNIGDAILRFCLDKDSDQEKIMSTGFVVLVFATIISLTLIPFSSFYETISTYSVYVYFYTITSAYTHTFMCYLRGKEYLKRYSIGNVIHTLTTAVLNVYFLAVLNRGIEGYLTAYVISNAVTAIYAFLAGNAVSVLKKFKFDYKLSVRMAGYSVVLIPNSFMWWIMNSSDRLMVTAMIGASANGIYAIAYKVPTLLATVVNVFNQAWSYSAIKEDESPDREEYNNRVFDKLFSFVALAACGLMMIMKIFLKYYVGADYYMSWKYTPYLMIGFVFNTLGSFVATSYTVNKDSMGFLLSSMAGAICNIFLNLFLIPVLGPTGAAVATCFSYLSVYVFRVLNTRKYIKINVLRARHLLGCGLLMITGASMLIDSILGQILLILEFSVMMFVFHDFWLSMIKVIFARIRR